MTHQYSTQCECCLCREERQMIHRAILDMYHTDALNAWTAFVGAADDFIYGSAYGTGASVLWAATYNRIVERTGLNKRFSYELNRQALVEAL